MCDRWRAHHYSLVGEIFTLDGNDQQWQVVRMASSRLDHRQHPQILTVPFPSHGPTKPTTIDLRQARLGSKWQPLPHDLVLTVREGDDPHSSDMEISDDDRPLPYSAGSCLQTHPPPHQQARDFLLQLMREGVFLGGPSVDEGGARPGPSTGLSDGPSAPVTVGDMAGNSDMEISDDDRPPPSSVGSCLQTHPPTHPAANDFLSSLLLEPDGDGVLPGDGPVDEAGAGVCPWARSVDTARGALIETIPDVNPLPASLAPSCHDLAQAALTEDHAAIPGGAVGPSYRQRERSRRHRRQRAKRNAATAASSLR